MFLSTWKMQEQWTEFPAVVEITVPYQTLSKKVSKMLSDSFYLMVGHYVWAPKSVSF